MAWNKFTEKEPSLNQMVLIAYEGRPYGYWLGVYVDFEDVGKPIYWLKIPKLQEDDEDQSS